LGGYLNTDEVATVISEFDQRIEHDHVVGVVTYWDTVGRAWVSTFKDGEGPRTIPRRWSRSDRTDAEAVFRRVNGALALDGLRKVGGRIKPKRPAGGAPLPVDEH
jgi:hypothetical protein